MKNPSKYGLLSLMITALAFAGACSDDSSSDGPEDPNPSVCDENNPCIDGYLCNAGTCFLKVSLDDACGIYGTILGEQLVEPLFRGCVGEVANIDIHDLI